MIAVAELPLAAAAQDTAPDLVGRWNVEAAGLVFDIPEKGAPRAVTSQSVYDIETQATFRFSGREVSQTIQGSVAASDKEQFAGLLSSDNKSASIVDENGFRDCRILSPEHLECVYKHIESHRSVITRQIWTKEKE